MRKESAVVRYLGESPIQQCGDIIDEFCAAIAGSITPDWLAFTRQYLRDMAAVKPLDTITPIDAQKYIAELSGRQATSTRNKKLVTIKKFYGWAVKYYRWPGNPFAGMKMTKIVRKNTEIKYLEKSEREAVLAAALKIPHGLAVWIVLYAGLRRNEVWRLLWEAIHWDSETVVAQSKRGASRTIPLAAPLLEQLKTHRKPSGLIFEPSGVPTCRDQARRVLEGLQKACSDIPADCVGWNPFRHTFCSLLVQAGVSLDKVAMWAGHSVDICREHYARFAPKDRKDSDIEKLG